MLNALGSYLDPTVEHAPKLRKGNCVRSVCTFLWCVKNDFLPPLLKPANHNQDNKRASLQQPFPSSGTIIPQLFIISRESSAACKKLFQLHEPVTQHLLCRRQHLPPCVSSKVNKCFCWEPSVSKENSPVRISSQSSNSPEKSSWNGHGCLRKEIGCFTGMSAGLSATSELLGLVLSVHHLGCAAVLMSDGGGKQLPHAEPSNPGSEVTTAHSCTSSNLA